MGPYLKICPEHVFVVEDGDGRCGFAVATSDSKHFYEQLKKHWLPEVCTNRVFFLMKVYFVNILMSIFQKVYFYELLLKLANENDYCNLP